MVCTKKDVDGLKETRNKQFGCILAGSALVSFLAWGVLVVVSA